MELQEIFDKYKPLAIYLVGSSCFLENTKDKDIVLYYETREQINEIKRKGVHFREENYDLHFDTIEGKCFTNSFIYHFRKHLIGEELNNDYDILNEHRQEYIEYLLKYIEHLPLNSKRWYSIIAGAYILKNNKYSFTKTQLKEIQAIHDKKEITEEIKEKILQMLK